jgi:spermidine/putrescine transport system permease protein
VYAFLFAPIAVLVVFSFSASPYSSVWGGFTLDWYARLLGNERLLEVSGNSLRVAAAATLVSVLLGTSAALALARARFAGRGAVQSLLYLPIVMPELVQGIALLMLFVLILPLPLGLGTIAIAHSVFGTAYVALVVGTRLHDLDPNLEEAARDLGANAWQTFYRVTLPLIWPGMVGGALLAFTLSFDDFVIAFFVTGPGASTLPIEIYSMVKRGITPEINALATLILAVSVILIALSLRVQRLNIDGDSR